MKWLRWFLPAAFLGLGPAMVAAQQPTTITGRVTDPAGTPLPAASVYIQALNLGTLTNTRGEFVLVVPAARAQGQTVQLLATQLGYKSASLSVTLHPGAIKEDFQLTTDPLMLQQLVVTGQGTSIQRQKLATDISTVSSASIQKSMETNVVEAMAAKAPGVQITSSGGDPGAGSYIQIRGAESISGGTQPLFVVDGTPIDNSSHNTDPQGSVAGTVVTNRGADINPADIDHIEILKGAAATAIYGSRAANGVVLITTKSGQAGSTRATLQMTYGADNVTKTVPLQTSFGQGTHGVANTGTSLSWGAPLTGPVYDHGTEMYQTGTHLDTDLTLSGGGQTTTYYMSLARLNQGGTIVGPQSYKRTNVRLKGSHFFLQNLEVQGNIAYTASDGNFVQQGSNISGIQLAALRTPPDFNNFPYIDPTTGFPRTYRNPNPTSLTQSHGYDNPFWVAYDEPSTSKVGRTFGNVGATYTPMPWLKVNYTFGEDYSGDDRMTLFPKGSDAYLNGEITRATLISNMWDSNLTMTASGDLTSKISGDLTLGQNFNEQTYYRNQTQGTTLLNGTDQTNDAVTNVGQEYRSDVRTDGLFASGVLSYADQLSLNGTIRRDGSNTFGGQNHFFYPGVGVAWTFTNTPGLNNIPLLSYGKLRADFGESGRQPPVYSNVSAYRTGSFGDGWITNGLYSLYDGKEGVFTQGTLGNDHIKPERLKEYEVGTDLAFLDQRIQAGFTYYNRETLDAILALPIPPSSGYNSEYENAGSWKQHGFEVTLGVDAVRTKDFTWNVTGNWTAERSCVTNLAGTTNFGLNGFTNGSVQVVGPDPTTGKCYQFGVLYGTDVVRYGNGVNDQVTGQPIDGTGNVAKGTVYVGADGYPQVDPEQRVIGDPHPQWMGSVRSTFTIAHNLTLSGLLDIQHGGQMWNGTQGALAYFGTAAFTAPYHGAGVTETYAQYCHCKVAGPGADTPVVIGQNFFAGVGSSFTGAASLFVQNAGFAKLRDVSVSYTFNDAVTQDLGMSAVDLTLSGRNLYTWTSYVGIDPESNLTGQSTGRGLDYFNNPQTRSLLVTVTLHR